MKRKWFDSMFQDNEIYRHEDHWGPLVVLEYSGHRVLTFGTLFEQSACYLKKPHTLVHQYSQAMLVAMLFKWPAHATFLGLGGGSLLRCLHYHFSEMVLEAVELREAVIEIAHDYFYVPDDERVSILCDNVSNFLANAQARSTDIIFSDLYNAHGMASIQSQQVFLEQCKAVLQDDGWLVINYHKLSSGNDPLACMMREVFPEIYWCAVSSGNYIMFCGKTPLTTPLDDLWPQVHQLEDRTGEDIALHFRRLVKMPA